MKHLTCACLICVASGILLSASSINKQYKRSEAAKQPEVPSVSTAASETTTTGTVSSTTTLESIVSTTVATTTTETVTTAPPQDSVPLYDILLSDELQEYTYTLCEYYSIVDYYEVVLGIMYTESGFNADAVSPTNDYGIMQINACNHQWLKEELDIVDIMDVHDNIECGIYMFSSLVHKHGSAAKALMAYNMGSAGASAMWSKGIYSSVYSDKVLGNTELIKSSKK